MAESLRKSYMGLEICMNFLLKNLTKLAVAFLLQFIFVSIALACMCPITSVRGEFDKSTNVIKATLQPFELSKITVEEIQTKNGSSLDLSSLIKKSPQKLKVQKVFKGNLQVGEVLDFDGVYRCSLSFTIVGGEYLLYLEDKPKQDKLWQIPGCSKSGLFENRLADLLYISKEKKVRNKNRLAGRLFYDKDAFAAKDKSEMPILANRKVYFIGESRVFEANTNKNGVYEIYDLPAGSYQVFSENIPGWKSDVSNYDSNIVEITKSGQYEIDLKYEIVGSAIKKAVDVGELSARNCLKRKK